MVGEQMNTLWSSAVPRVAPVLVLNVINSMILLET